ncbi:hypothetical protein EYF80_033010 [Liparis tanakae]|uniref:Uncharacterized protein n=1 Tax=Liparis tanakae TaxID=230148 RepID=A0A4Z2GVI4_9TELE|nr:hypothetical protein EYF80_033010 [Liparis tanakae]
MELDSRRRDELRVRVPGGGTRLQRRSQLPPSRDPGSGTRQNEFSHPPAGHRQTDDSGETVLPQVVQICGQIGGEEVPCGLDPDGSSESPSARRHSGLQPHFQRSGSV